MVKLNEKLIKNWEFFEKLNQILNCSGIDIDEFKEIGL